MGEKFDRNEYQRNWKKQHSVGFSIRLFHSTDADIIGYLDEQGKKGISKASVFKEAVREKMNREEE